MSGRRTVNCDCASCSPAPVSALVDRFALWIAIVAFVAIPGRALLHLALGAIS